MDKTEKIIQLLRYMPYTNVCSLQCNNKQSMPWIDMDYNIKNSPLLMNFYEKIINYI